MNCYTAVQEQLAAQASCPLVQPEPHHKTTPMPKVQETVPVAERHVQNQAALKSSATGAASCSVLYKATIPSGATPIALTSGPALRSLCRNCRNRCRMNPGKDRRDPPQ